MQIIFQWGDLWPKVERRSFTSRFLVSHLSVISQLPQKSIKQPLWVPKKNTIAVNLPHTQASITQSNTVKLCSSTSGPILQVQCPIQVRGESVRPRCPLVDRSAAYKLITYIYRGKEDRCRVWKKQAKFWKRLETLGPPKNRPNSSPVPIISCFIAIRTPQPRDYRPCNAQWNFRDLEKRANLSPDIKGLNIYQEDFHPRPQTYRIPRYFPVYSVFRPLSTNEIPTDCMLWQVNREPGLEPHSTATSMYLEESRFGWIRETPVSNPGLDRSIPIAQTDRQAHRFHPSH